MRCSRALGIGPRRALEEYLTFLRTAIVRAEVLKGKILGNQD
jgi:hypothetical protein